MQISFYFDIDDYIAFQYHYRQTTRIFRINNYVIWTITTLVVLCNIIAVSLLSEYDLSNLLFPIGFLTFAGVFTWLLCTKKGIKVSLRRLIKKEQDNPQVFGERAFLFEDDYFMAKTTKTEGKADWSVIRKMDETPDYFFLYTANFMAYVIPKHKIATQVQNLQAILHQHIPQEKYRMCKK